MPIRTPIEQQKQPQQQPKDVSERGTNCNEGMISSHVPEEPHNPNLTKISTVHNQSNTNPKISEEKKNPKDLTQEQPKAQLLEENRIPKAKQENINKYNTSDQKIATPTSSKLFSDVIQWLCVNNGLLEARCIKGEDLLSKSIATDYGENDFL